MTPVPAYVIIQMHVQNQSRDTVKVLTVKIYTRSRLVSAFVKPELENL